MNAYELAEKLKRRRQEIAAANDWVVFDNKGLTADPAIRLTYSTIYINKAGRAVLGLEKGMRVSVAYSPASKVVRITKSADGRGYCAQGPGGTIPARAIYRSFGLDVLPLRDMPGKQQPNRPALVVDDGLVVDVSDLVISPATGKVGRD